MVLTQTLGRFRTVYRSLRNQFLQILQQHVFTARSLDSDTVTGLSRMRKVLVVRYVLLIYLLLVLSIVRGALYSQHYEAHYKSDYVWILSAHLAVFIPMNIVMGVLADRLFGRAEMLLAGLIICTAAYSLNMMSPSLGWVCFAEAIYGIGEACFTATAGAWYRYKFAILHRKKYRVEHGVDKLQRDSKKWVQDFQKEMRNAISRKVFSWKYPLVMALFPFLLMFTLKYVSVMFVGWVTVSICCSLGVWFFVVDPLPSDRERKELTDPKSRKEKFREGFESAFKELFLNKKIIRLSMTGIINSASWSAIAALMYFEVYRSELTHFANLLGIACLVVIGIGHIVQSRAVTKNPERDEIEWMHKLLFISGCLVLIIGLLSRFEKLVYLELIMLGLLSFTVGRFNNLFMGSIFDYVRPGNEGDRTSIMSIYLSVDKVFVLICNWSAYAMTARYSLGGSVMMIVLAMFMMTAGGWGWLLDYAKKRIPKKVLRAPIAVNIKNKKKENRF